MKRRDLLKGLGLSTLAMPWLARSGYAAEEQAAETVEYLFVQSAGRARLTDGTLRLGHISPTTVYFSDRPERIAGHITTHDFVSEWGKGEDSFMADSPNATLSILSGSEPQEIVVVLSAPRLENNDLVYDIEVLEGKESAEGGASSLFIDVIGRPMSPASFAGRRRRIRRRAVNR